MAIKGYTTEVDPAKTAGQISALLATKGARAIQIEYEGDGVPAGLSFAVEIGGKRFFYKLPARPEGVLAALKKDKVEPRYQNLAHARRVAWRIIFDWVAAQIALIEAGAAELPEIFLPFLMTGPNETMYERFVAGGGLLLLGGGGEVPHVE